MNNIKKNASLVIGLLIILVGIIGFRFSPISKTFSSQKEINIYSPGLAFISHITHNFVTVIDLKTNKIVDTIYAEKGTDWFTLSENRKKAYIANFNSNSISIINTHDNNNVNLKVGTNPVCICLSLDGQTALISHQSQDGLWFMNTTTHQITKKIIEGTGLLHLSKDGRKIYQAAIFQPYVHIINPFKQTIEKSIYVSGRPLNLDFTPNGKYIYVTNSDLNEVQIIDTKTDSVVNKISDIDTTRGIAISPNGKYALVTNVRSNSVTVINIKDNSVVKKISVDRMPTDIAITKDGKSAYITNQGSGSISIISIDKLKVVNNIEVADNPISIYISEWFEKGLGKIA